MPDKDTIAAISTPPGPGGVGMVRITGPLARTVGLGIFSPLARDRGQDLEPRKAFVGHVHFPGHRDRPIDQAVWLFFQGPRSYTGEDTVEITAHGGPLIMGSVLEAALEAGARLAEPGEFTRRAFENGRIDLSQAEAVASLIFASTSEAREIMQRQAGGAMGREAGALRSGLLEAKVLLESAIDFPEDIEELDSSALRQAVAGVLERAQRLLDTSREGIAMTEGIRVVIAGAPNVGKSSLLNALLQKERAIVHEVAGTTRDFIEGRISILGIPMVVVDTAGIRSPADELEGAGMARTRDLVKEADLLLLLLDRSRKASQDERELLRETGHARRVVVLNKCDLAAHPGHQSSEEAVMISALTGRGLEELKKRIHDTYTAGGPSLADADAVVTTVRQTVALEKVRLGCASVLEGLSRSREAVLLAVDLEEALMGVAELTGEVTPEEVLEEVFARFCIGK